MKIRGQKKNIDYILYYDLLCIKLIKKKTLQPWVTTRKIECYALEAECDHCWNISIKLGSFLWHCSSSQAYFCSYSSTLTLLCHLNPMHPGACRVVNLSIFIYHDSVFNCNMFYNIRHSKGLIQKVITTVYHNKI